jgi:hypothetical protein
MKTYIHSIPGRLRIRAERFSSDSVSSARMQAELRRMSGVAGVEFRAASSSVVVRYDARTSVAEQILFLLQKRGYLDGGFETNVKPAAAVKDKSADLSSRLVSHIQKAAVASVASYLIEAAIVRFAPPGAKLLLPLVRRSLP